MIQFVCLILPGIVSVLLLSYLERSARTWLQFFMESAFFIVVTNLSVMAIYFTFGTRREHVFDSRLFTVSFSFQYLFVAFVCAIAAGFLFHVIKKNLAVHVSVEKEISPKAGE